MSQNETCEVFSGLVENRPSKFVFIILALIIDVFNIMMAYGVIWYDRYGVDMKQTLMNKLITSLCWGIIINIPILQLFEIPRFFFGPQPAFFCFASSFLRNAVKWQTLLLLDASILARHISIFWLKNPSAVHEDFWTMFINIWICGISVITNFVFFYRQGRIPIFYFTRIDQDPAPFADLPSSGGHIDVFSFLLHGLIKIRILIFKSEKIRNFFARNKVFAISTTLTGTEDQSLTDFTWHLAFLVMSILYTALFAKTNQLSVVELNSHPNYYYYYTLQFLGMSIMCFLACILQYLRNSKMRKGIFAELKNFIDW